MLSAAVSSSCLRCDTWNYGIDLTNNLISVPGIGLVISTAVLAPSELSDRSELRLQELSLVLFLDAKYRLDVTGGGARAGSDGVLPAT